jgi:heme-degrading monooxygenase HmoA
MIVRITRARIRPRNEASAFEMLRTVAASTRRPDGLDSIHIGRRATSDGDELVVVTVWRDLEALQDSLGPDFEKPAFAPELDGFLEDVTVELYETIVDQFEDLEAIAK